MKTTLIISEELMRRVEAEAAARGITASELVETALRRALEEPEADADLPPMPTWSSGGLQVDVADRRALHEALDQG